MHGYKDNWNTPLDGSFKKQILIQLGHQKFDLYSQTKPSLEKDVKKYLDSN